MPQKFVQIVLVVFLPIFVVKKLIPLMPSFRIPRINKTKSFFIQYSNFVILVYITATISFCNLVPQFKNTVYPVVMLSHVGKFLLKITFTDMYEYCMFVESLR